MTSRVADVPALRPCGEHAWLLDLDDNAMVHRWAAAIREAELPGVREVVPGLTTVLVTFDAGLTNASALRAALCTLQPRPDQSEDHDHHVIDVRYDGEDLDDVSKLTGLTVAEVIAAHTESVWTVAFCGFAPGFSYLVGGDPRLYVPRRDESRVRVPAGAVAIAGAFSAVYPRVSPGGWQLLGHTDAVLWDSAADPPAVLRPGAVVQFRRVGS
ncbi:5-oxoprolinase subunit B family protein [Mycolicibacterium arseniciresistens]|uniref:Allophanate hydrolase subunit 1 n=1 Tax=Mycolicibacterium arseniciresistens TaxID=3062257 RepID=A0ABT8UBC8_9MYCO|nr:allophanate hydrolase subunit 1 [Mycolicibacterium arseniciresistens]MDO3634422.1 allophanate hydrolase subunit 1 [Mycolicibacterium arseniciresistens]